MTRQEMYDLVCRVLTDYEGNGDPDNKNNNEELYVTLVKVQNYFDEEESK